MTSKKRRLGAAVVYPILLFMAGVALSATGAYFERQSIEKNARAEFERMAVRTEAEVESRMVSAVNALRGARGLYAASQRVERNEFSSFVLSRDMEREFPGVRGFGFIQRVERTDLAAFVAAEQADHAPQFAIRQLADKAQADLFVIKFIEPANNNKGAQGLDVGSEPLRRSGIRQAINTGAATVTGAITLVQDNKKQPGVLLYLPVYRNGAPTDNQVERNAALVGVLYTPMVMAEVLDGLPDVKTGLLDFEILDAPINSSGGVVMFDADDHLGHLAAGADPAQGRRFSLRKPLELPGRNVTLTMHSTPAFDASVNRTFPFLLLGGGTLISTLLAFMLRQQTGGRLRAERLAHGMTRDLQSAVRDNQALLSTLNLHAIVSIADLGGRIVEANDAFCNISGYSREELLGQDHRIVNSGVHATEFWVDMWETISSGMPWHSEVCNMGKDGHLYWVDTVIAPFFGDDEKIEKYVSIRTDISLSKRAQQDALQSSALLRGSIEAIDEAFVLYDPQDRLVLCNQAFRDTYAEIAHLMVPGVRFEDLLRAGAEQGQYVAAIGRVDEWVAERVTAHQLGNTTLVQKLSNGRVLHIIERRLADGHMVGFRIDITELALATEAAQAASLSKSQFLANMSHEIRTPMNAILGMLTLLRKTELTTRQADYAAKSDGAARALLGLLNEILDFSKIEAGKMTLDPHPFAIDRVLRDLSVILSSNVGEKPVEVLFDVDPRMPRQLVGDAMRLQQVLLNLGSNAIKFTAQGEVVLCIRVVLCDDDVVTLQFSMRDSGIGIAPENQARIFSGFTQAESSTTRRFGGTGLGIAISQRFVSMMGGELELQSELGKGSRFYFSVTLPIVAAETLEEQDRMRARADSASWRTLVIDDSPNAREVLEHMGQSLGWKIDLAESGAQALHMLEQRTAQGIHYQAIFVDWSMPDMDGWQTSQHIRDLQAERAKAGDTTVAPVVIMITSHGREMLTQRSAAEQALLDGFLVKPITASMLFDAVIDARASHDQPHPSHLTAQATQHRLEGMRLLLVEDNLNNQQVARELLEDEGAVVQIANHGQEAVEAIAAAAAANAGGANTAAFDVVLMDLQMPVMDGFAATRAIRRDLGQATLPIVAMTANAMASDRDACLGAGMNDHVGKPFDINDLVRVLRRQAQWGDALVEPVSKEIAITPGALQAAAAGGVDITSALHRMGGKQDVYRRMLQTFVGELQAMPEQLKAFAQQHQQGATPDEARRVLHTLKGLASMLGASALSRAAASAEKAMATGLSTQQNADITAQVGTAITTALPPLRELLQALEQAHADQAADGAGDAAAPLDRPALVAALGAMVALLQADDMEAMNAMAALQQQFGEALGNELNALEAAMSEMAFDVALPHCQALLEKYADGTRG